MHNLCFVLTADRGEKNVYSYHNVSGANAALIEMITKAIQKAPQEIMRKKALN